MKLLKLLTALVLLVPLCAHAAYRTGISADITTEGTSVTTTAITTESGDVAVLGFQQNYTCAMTVSDHYGNTWTQQKVSGLISSFFYDYVYTAPMTTYGSSETFTISWTSGSCGNQYGAVQVVILSGRNTSVVLDGTPGAYEDSSYGTSHTGASVTTSVTGSDVVEIASDGGTSTTETYTAGSGFTVEQSSLGSGSTYFPSMIQVKANATAGTQTGAWTTGNTVEGGAVIIAVEAASGTCTHEGYTSAGALATPNGSSGSYVGSAGAFVTPNCSSTSYWQPTVGNFGVN